MPIELAAPLDLATFDAILKDYYIGPIRDLLNSKTILLKRISRKQVTWSGRQALLPVRIGRNEGVGAIGELGNMPDPGRQRYERLTILARRLYARILFDGAVVAASRNPDGAFADAVDTEVAGVAIDIKNDWNRILFGNGSGRLAQVNGVGAAPTYGVDNPGGFANPGPGTQYLRPNMVVGIFNEVTGAFRGSATVTAVDAAAQTITLNNAIVGAGDNEFFYRISEDTAGVPGALPPDSWGAFNEPVGIAGAVNDEDLPGPAGGTRDYEGMDAATTPVWISPVLDNGGVAIPLDLAMLQELEDAVDQAGDGLVSIYLCSYGLRRSYLGLLQTDKRYVNTMELDGGWRTLEFNDKPLVPDKDATWGRIYALDEATFGIYEQSPLRWIDDDGHILRRREDTHAFQAALMAFWDMGCTARNRSGRLEDLLDPL